MILDHLIMLNIIIGHRGTGKTFWLNELKGLYKKHKIIAEFYDLDEEIEKAEGCSVFELFQQGELIFRNKEKELFKMLTQSIITKGKTCFLSVGAGLTFKKNPLWNVIHLSRYSDKTGRIFLDRPRLDHSQNPLVEYKNLYKKRQSYYSKQADEQLVRREHFKHIEDSDMLFLNLKKQSHPCFTFCLNPKDVPKSKNRLKKFLQKRKNWGLRFFELNDQTATPDFVRTIRELVPDNKILFSSQTSKIFLKLKNKKHWSWDLNLGEPPKGVNILTLHHRQNKTLQNILKRFSTYKNYHLKLAVEIFNFQELILAYRWQCEDSKNRSFLPRSFDGRWLWFRQAFGPQMFLHFIKERSSGTQVLDQPFLAEAVPFIHKPKALAGVLGHPILFSATPAEHDDFFKGKKNISVLSIPLQVKEMTKGSLKILSELGFVFFAVTSPLKAKAFLLADICDKNSQEFKTVNSLIFHKGVWQAFNTDWYGLQSLKQYSSKTTVVWGGGGIRPILKKLLPLAWFYSARKAHLLPFEQKQASQNLQKKHKSDQFSPSTLIWAVGRNRMEQGCLMPPKHWTPSQVIDINYTEDSPGLEYALLVGASYQNGFKFFKVQAQKQREIFEQI